MLQWKSRPSAASEQAQRQLDLLLAHIELDHDVPVERAGETAEQALARVKTLNPRIGGPECRCPECAWAVGLAAKTAGA